jgi:hypothetical protein
MDNAPILICYDDSAGARHAITAAAALFGGRWAVVLDVAPPLTVRESYASLGAVTPDFEELNTADALQTPASAPTSPATPASQPRRGPTSPLRPGTGWSRPPTTSTQP